MTRTSGVYAIEEKNGRPLISVGTDFMGMALGIELERAREEVV